MKEVYLAIKASCLIAVTIFVCISLIHTNDILSSAEKRVEEQASRVIDGDPKATNPEDRKTLRQFAADRAISQIQESEGRILAEIDEVRKSSDERIDGVTTQILGEWHQTVVALNDRASDSIKIVGDTSKDLSKQIQEVNGNVRSTLKELKDTTKDLHDSWDDMYWDLKATVGSVNVAATSVAQTMETVRDASPKIAKSVGDISDSAAGVAEDVKREADEITKPKKWWQKVLGPFYTVARIIGVFM